MSKWNIALIGALLFAGYFAWNCWQDERAALKEVARIDKEYAEYKENNKAVKQLEINIIEAIKNANNNTDNLRNDVDNGLVELRIKVESIERDSTATNNTANTALRLARTSQQAYFNLVNGINYNKAMIEGWQKYYCLEIAPKNGTEFMCNEDKRAIRGAIMGTELKNTTNYM